MDSRISLIRTCEWEEVFLEWYKNEGKNPDWQVLAQERGFSNWAEWRLRGYAERFKCREVDWGLYEITDPSEVISGWYGGPFRTWIERYYDGLRRVQFAMLAEREDLRSLKKIISIMEEYPTDSVITALELPDGTIQVIEGMHRSVALSIMARAGKFFHGKLNVAIGKTTVAELPEVGLNTSV